MKYITIGINSRISLGEEDSGLVPICWNTGDQMLVNKSKKSTAVTADYDGKSTAVIGVPVDTAYPMTLVYPVAISKGAKWCYIDTKQTYKPNLLANGYAILMGVADNAEDVVMMEHKCGYMRVQLTGSATVKTVMLRTIGHEPLSGYFRYPTTGTTDGKIDLINFNRENIYANGFYDSPVIFIDCGENGELLSGEPKEFSFALPARTYSKGFALTVIDTNGNQHCVQAYTEGKEVKAGALIDMPILNVNCNEPVGIYNGNEFAGYVRTIEKNLWLNGDTTLNIYGEVDLSNEKFNDIASTLADGDIKKRVNGELLYYRFTEGTNDTYNCDAITCIDGHGNAIVGYNNTATGDAALFVHTIPAELTIQNLTLGKWAATPESDNADCTLTVTTNGAADDTISYVGGFCHTLLGKIENCNSYASVKVIGKGKGLVQVGGLAGTTGAESSIDNSKNYGYIHCDLEDVTGGSDQHFIGGIVPTNLGGITVCENAGAVKVINTATAVRLGGVVGQTANNLSGCTNSGSVILDKPSVGCRLGGVVGQAESLVTSCINTGSIIVNSAATCHIGGIVGTNACENQTFDGCVNGEEGDTTKGAITATLTANNIYLGGICGYTNRVSSFNNMKNYGSIAASGIKTIYLGGVIGYAATNVINITKAYNYGSLRSEGGNASYIGGVGGDLNVANNVFGECCNYGEITISENIANGWHYVGGVFGRINATSTAEHLGNEDSSITITDCAAKMRVGGICGYLSATTKCVAKNLTITIDGIGADSSIGGWGGYIPGGKIVGDDASASEMSGAITVTDKVTDSSVCVGGLFGTVYGVTVRNTNITNFVMTNSSPARCGLVTTYPLTANKTLSLGSATKPFKIGPSVTFLGVKVTDINSISNNPEDGKVNLVNEIGATYSHKTINTTYVTVE